MESSQLNVKWFHSLTVQMEIKCLWYKHLTILSYSLLQTRITTQAKWKNEVNPILDVNIIVMYNEIYAIMFNFIFITPHARKSIEWFC